MMTNGLWTSTNAVLRLLVPTLLVRLILMAMLAIVLTIKSVHSNQITVTTMGFTLTLKAQSGNLIYSDDGIACNDIDK